MATDDLKKMTYEEKMEELDAMLRQLDDSEIPIDVLAKKVKRGVDIIKDLESTLKKVELEVKDAFEDLGDDATNQEEDSSGECVFR